jgi:hypothetical protein
MDNLRVDLRAGAGIRCQIRREVPRGDVHDLAVHVSQNSAMKATVILRSAEGLPLDGVVATDSTLGEPYLRDIAPGRYWVDLTGLPSGYYVKRIHYGDQDALDRPIRITSTNGATQPALEVLLSSNTYDVSGTVVGASSSALHAAQVFLAPLESGASINRLMRGTLTKSDGTFELRNVPPGDYSIVAFEDVAPGLGEDPGFRALFADTASPVGVGSGASRNITVRAVPKERALAAERAGSW